MPNKKDDWCNPTGNRRRLLQSYPTEEVIDAILPDRHGNCMVQSYLTKQVIGAILQDKGGDWRNPS
jgi:hypothetical protein